MRTKINRKFLQLIHFGAIEYRKKHAALAAHGRRLQGEQPDHEKQKLSGITEMKAGDLRIAC